MTVPEGTLCAAQAMLPPVGSTVVVRYPGLYEYFTGTTAGTARVFQHIESTLGWYVRIQLQNGRVLGVYPNHVQPITPHDDMADL